MIKENTTLSLPDPNQIEEALEYERQKEIQRYIFVKLISGIVIIAALLTIAAVWCLPLLSIQGTSMSPTLHDGDIVIFSEKGHYDAGDIIIFKHTNTILVKRIIACEGDIVNIDELGNVYVNDKKLNESYILEKALGSCNIELPFQVPPDAYFVMGDNRTVSSDSRMASIGTVTHDNVLGKVLFKLWPFGDFELLA